MFVNQLESQIWSNDEPLFNPWGARGCGMAPLVDIRIPPPGYPVPPPRNGSFYGDYGNWAQNRNAWHPGQGRTSPVRIPAAGMRKITKTPPSSFNPEASLRIGASSPVSSDGSLSSSCYESSESDSRLEWTPESDNRTSYGGPPFGCDWADLQRHLQKMSIDRCNTMSRNIHQYQGRNVGSTVPSGPKRGAKGGSGMDSRHVWNNTRRMDRDIGQPKQSQQYQLETKPFLGGNTMAGCRKQRCEFCLNNARYAAELTGRPFIENSPNAKWNRHRCKDPVTGDIICPVLKAKCCPECGATGAKAHTLRYCPKKKARELDAQLKPKKAFTGM